MKKILILAAAACLLLSACGQAAPAAEPSPGQSEAAETAGLVHGTNERISQRSYIQGIRVLIRIMETACGFANAEI